jgi:hypothetical protein
MSRMRRPGTTRASPRCAWRPARAAPAATWNGALLRWKDGSLLEGGQSPFGAPPAAATTLVESFAPSNRGKPAGCLVGAPTSIPAIGSPRTSVSPQ